MQSEVGREDNLLGGGLKELAQRAGASLTGTSVFDPVLCEVVYNWFCPKNGIVFDPFAGGSVRGIVAEMLDRRYIGIDLSEKQIDANQLNADKIGVCPAWYCDDAKNADKYINDSTADLVFTCPPYHNLEKYSDHPLDLSNMSYADFIEAYTEIINTACRKLKKDRFAVWVVGDVRDNKGAYRDFVGDTKQIFKSNGLHLYNDIVLLEQIATAAMRAGLAFRTNRKVTKVHHNVLVFYKGDLKQIRHNYENDFKRLDLTHYVNS